MKSLTYILVLLYFISTDIYAQENNKKTHNNLSATIDLKKQREPISKYLYGMFIENLGNDDVGNLVDDGLWAELLDDRKFFYSVDTITKLTPINRKEKINQWYPVGNSEKVVMDSIASYVGVHSPKIRITNGEVNGIAQSGIALKKNVGFTGRVILKGTEGVTVFVHLIWGEKPSQRETIKIKELTSVYQQKDVLFKFKKKHRNATLSIEGKGNGSFSIGAVSLMPDDNIDGFRPDVIKLLKNLNSGIYRWGGNFISGFDWRDGVGNPDKRPPRYEFAWRCLEDNDVSTHEMIRFAELINVELSMTVNTGFGDANSAAQWVEYVNGSTETEMGKLRAKNGHPKPFGINLWCVGNESYGWWQLGKIDLKNHIIKHNMFVEKMLAVDATITLIGSGALIGEMTVTESAFKETGKLIPEYGSETDWTGGMLKQANNISYISEHFYCSVTERFDLKKGKYVEVNEPLEDWTRRPANRIKVKSEHYTEYHKRIPSSKNIPIYLDEWAYYTNWVHPSPTLGVAIGYARGLHEMFRHTDLIKMAGFTFATSCLSFTDTEADYNATGLLFKLYQSKLESIPVQVNGNSPQPNPKWSIGGEQPKVNAGGDVYPLDIIATISEDGENLTIGIINPTETVQHISFNFGEIKMKKKVIKWILSGESVSSKNCITASPEVLQKESSINLEEEYTIAAATINILKFKILKNE